MVRLLYILTTVVLLFSCADLRREDQLTKVAALQKKTDSLEVALRENRLDTLSRIHISIFSLESRIRDNYTADTINEQLARQMEKFRQLKQYFLAEHEEEEMSEEKEDQNLSEKSLSSAYVVVKDGLESQKKTLADLYNDIQNGLGERDKYDEYISFEAEKVKQLCALMDNYKAHKEKILKQFRTVYQNLHEFTCELEEKKRIKKH